MSKFSGLALAVEKPQRMPLLHPTTNEPLKDDKGREAYIDLYSSDSDVARKQERAISRRRLNVRGRTKVSPEEIESASLDMLVAITAGWHLVDLAGKAIDVQFNASNARELYEEAELSWVRDQVDQFAGDRANFLPASSTS